MKVGIGEYTECFFYVTHQENTGPGIVSLDISEELYARYCRARDEWQRVQCDIDVAWQRQHGEGEP